MTNLLKDLAKDNNAHAERIGNDLKRILSAQYGPLEAILKRDYPEQYELYKYFPAMKQIKALELLAMTLGL